MGASAAPQNQSGNALVDLRAKAVEHFVTSELMTNFHFDVNHIGGNWPTIDLYAEVREAGDKHYHCFFQVKSTVQGYRKKSKKLVIGIELASLKRLALINAPTYIIGVDSKSDDFKKWRMYLYCIQGKQKNPISSFSCDHEITKDLLTELTKEVRQFWEKSDVPKQKVRFKSRFL
jgi:hypothetical protein